MSCIRGHRTTSCGIPVCRTKIFWTVKRPGRPSNSCTCRYGASGGCKCVVAQSACPHKSKKGEKRSGVCRCDEQGRYCCLLEPEHWNALLALGKPIVDFYPTKEALDAKLVAPLPSTIPQSPSCVTSSPRSPSSASSTPGLPNRPRTVRVLPNSYNTFHVKNPSFTARFGMMGVGAPQGSGSEPPPDVLFWQGDSPEAPREYHTPTVSHVSPSSLSTAMTSLSPESQVSNTFQPSSTIAGAIDFERLQADYFNYQFPSAICQNCGLNGCTCKNCPPVFQNFGTTSWAQCCGRKHARDVQPQTAQKVSRLRPSAAGAQETLSPVADTSDNHLNGGLSQPSTNGMSWQSSDLPPSELDSLGFGNGIIMPDDPMALDISEFLVSDLDRSEESTGGCCCGDT